MIKGVSLIIIPITVIIISDSIIFEARDKVKENCGRVGAKIKSWNRSERNFISDFQRASFFVRKFPGFFVRKFPGFFVRKFPGFLLESSQAFC
jgi:hypothetical protein